LVGIILPLTPILFESWIVESHAHGLTTYSLLVFYGCTPMQWITIYGGNPMSMLENLSIHTIVSFLIVNSNACDSMFTQLIICALLVRLYDFFTKLIFV
jgi:hypothetical protein